MRRQIQKFHLCGSTKQNQSPCVSLQYGQTAFGTHTNAVVWAIDSLYLFMILFFHLKYFCHLSWSCNCYVGALCVNSGCCEIPRWLTCENGSWYGNSTPTHLCSHHWVHWLWIQRRLNNILRIKFGRLFSVWPGNGSYSFSRSWKHQSEKYRIFVFNTI